MTGRFIVLEGPDCSGTTKQSQLLAERLKAQSIDVLLTAEPTHSSIGEEIRALLHGKDMPQPDAIQLLFCADRAEHVAQEILPALQRGTTVVSDRYTLSTLVYGAAQGIPEDWLRTINSRFPEPDITIITLPPLEVCRERMRHRLRQDQYENGEFQRKIHEAYAAVRQRKTVFVDTSQSKQESAAEIWQHVESLFL